MNNAEEVEKYIELMNLPEEVVSLGPDFGVSKDEYGRHRDPEDNTSNTCSKKVLYQLLFLFCLSVVYL